MLANASPSDKLSKRLQAIFAQASISRRDMLGAINILLYYFSFFSNISSQSSYDRFSSAFNEFSTRSIA